MNCKHTQEVDDESLNQILSVYVYLNDGSSSTVESREKLTGIPKIVLSPWLTSPLAILMDVKGYKQMKGKNKKRGGIATTTEERRVFW